MFVLNLSPILEARGINRAFTFFRKCGFTHSTASKLSREEIRNIQLDQIEKLCMILKCTPNDILRWVPDDQYDIDETHPVWELKKEDEEFIDLSQLMRDLPIDKLKEVQRAIRDITQKGN